MDGAPDKTKIILAKLEYDHKIARLGLQGTLWGAWAALFAIVIIVVAQALTDRYPLQGWPLAFLAGVVVVSVIFYGAFIFNRALSVSGTFDNKSIEFTADAPIASPKNQN